MIKSGKQCEKIIEVAMQVSDVHYQLHLRSEMELNQCIWKTKDKKDLGKQWKNLKKEEKLKKDYELSYLRKCALDSLNQAYLTGDKRYVEVAKYFKRLAKINFSTDKSDAKLLQISLNIREALLFFGEYESLDGNWRRKALHYIVVLRTSESHLRKVIKRMCDLETSPLAGESCKKILSALTQLVPTSLAQCYKIVAAIRDIKALRRFVANNSLYSNKSAIFRKNQLKKSDLDNPLTYAKMVSSQLENYEIKHKITICLGYALLTGDSRYVTVAQALNAGFRLDWRIKRVEDILEKYNPNWIFEALYYIRELGDKESPSNILQQKTNLARQYRKFPPRSYQEVWHRLVTINYFSVLECYELVEMLNSLRNRFRFVDLGSYETKSNEYKQLIEKASFSELKDEDDNQFQSNVERQIKWLLCASIMTGIEDPYLTSAGGLRDQAIEKWGSCIYDEIYLEIKNLFTGNRYNPEWKNQAQYFINEFNEGTYINGKSSLREFVREAIKNEELAGFSERELPDLVEALTLPTLDSAYSRYKTVARLSSIPRISELFPRLALESSEPKQQITFLRKASRSFSSLLPKKFINTDNEIFERIKKFGFKAEIPLDYLSQHAALYNYRRWTKKIQECFLAECNLNMRAFIDKYVENMKNLLFMSLHTTDERWLRIYEAYNEVLRNFKPGQEDYLQKLEEAMQNKTIAMQNKFCKERSFLKIFDEVKRVFENKTHDYWKVKCKDFIKNIQEFIKSPNMDSRLKDKIEETFPLEDVFEEMKTLLASEKPSCTLDRYLLVEKLCKMQKKLGLQIEEPLSSDEDNETVCTVFINSDYSEEIDLSDDHSSSKGKEKLPEQNMKLPGRESAISELLAFYSNDEEALNELVHFLNCKHINGTQILTFLSSMQFLREAGLAPHELLPRIKEHRNSSSCFTNNAKGN